MLWSYKSVDQQILKQNAIPDTTCGLACRHVIYILYGSINYVP